MINTYDIIDLVDETSDDVAEQPKSVEKDVQLTPACDIIDLDGDDDVDNDDNASIKSGKSIMSNCSVASSVSDRSHISILSSKSDLSTKSFTSYKSDTSLQSKRSFSSAFSYQSTGSKVSQVSSVPSYHMYASFSQPIPSSQQFESTQPRRKRTKREQQCTEVEIRRQLTGKYRYEEIGVIISDAFGKSAEKFPDALRNQFLMEEEKISPLCIHESFSLTMNCIRFTFRPKAFGGMCNINDEKSTVLPFAIVLFPTDEFVKLVYSKSESPMNEYVEIAKRFHDLESMLMSVDNCPQNTKVVFIVMDIEKEVLNFRKTLSKKDKKNIDVNDILSYLLHEEKVHVLPVVSVQHTAEYVYTFTKVIASWVYKQDTESEYISRQRCSRLGPEDEASSREKNKLMLQETWIRMLQMIPKVSNEKARTFVRDEKLSCPLKLLDVYSDANLSVDQKKALLQSSFSSKAGREIKISKQIYNLFVELDPSFSLSD